MPEGAWLGPKGGRILVFDVDPERLARLAPDQLPEAIAVLGQPDFNSWEDIGVGPGKIGGSGRTLVDARHQHLFFADGDNNRILVWDISPDKLRNGADAIAVIGQPDFFSNTPGAGRNRLGRVGSLALDPTTNRLFVSDGTNYRVLVFNVHPDNLRAGMGAMAVMGQKDFDSRVPRRDLRKISTGPLAVDYRFQRLFEAEGMLNRVLIFDIHPDRMQEIHNPDAIAVLGQPTFSETDPAVTRSRLTMPRVTVDSENQLAYIPDGYPARNGITIFDVHPARMKTTGTEAIDQLGHINADGEPDFLARSANDRVGPRAWTNGRSVALDPVDHRLFLTDNYGHRVLVFQLDDLNRIQDRDAKWVLGQKDLWTSHLLPGRDARSIKLPLAVAYDARHKRAFVADAWNDRVLVYDMTPGRTHSGMPASHVLGQKDFESWDPRPARNRIDFGARWGRGIGTANARAQGLAVDEQNHRLFVTDGGNNRVLVFDIHPDRIHNGADAIAVIGQQRFDSVEGGGAASLAALTRGDQIAELRSGQMGNIEEDTGERWTLPGDLAYDPNHQRLFVEVPFQHRVLVFDVDPSRLENGMSASLIIGQPDFRSDQPGLSRRRFTQPDGISYDSRNNRLYVSDKGNHRVLVFDARPEVLENFPEALFVIGEETFDTVTMGRGLPRWHQKRLHDPRGSAFDPEGQRLFQSEGLNTRISVYSMPRESHDLFVRGRGMLSYQSLDAPRGSDLTVGHSELLLDEPARALGISYHYRTRPFSHKVSQRESRVLVSEALLAATSPVESAQILFDSRRNSRLEISVVNPADRDQTVTLTLRDAAGAIKAGPARRTLGAGEQLSVSADQVFGGLSEELLGSLVAEGESPVKLAGLLQLPNGRDEFLMLGAPQASAGDLGPDRQIIPRIARGAGHETELVLLNPTDQRLEGSIEMEGVTSPYAIRPGGVFLHPLAGAGGPAYSTHALVRAETGPAPPAHALTRSLRRDGSVQYVQAVTGFEGSLFWAPVDTEPSLLRHQRKGDAELTVLNRGRVPATVYLELFNLQGERAHHHEQTIPYGERVEISLEEAFGKSPLKGMLRIFSNTPVTFALEKRTQNVEEDWVVTSIPLQQATAEHIRMIFPVFMDGSGFASEIQLLNTEKVPLRGHLQIRGPDGKLIQTILR